MPSEIEMLYRRLIDEVERFQNVDMKSTLRLLYTEPVLSGTLFIASVL